MTIRPQYFGTDGLRAPFGKFPLDEITLRRLAVALAATLRADHGNPKVILGGDTRESTPLIATWLAGELEAAGVEVIYLGVVPTPAIAQLVRHQSAQAGIAVSASHNPFPDNGVKLLDSQGFKWSEAAEIALESRVWAKEPPRTTGLDGALAVDFASVAWYRKSLLAAVGPVSLAGLRVGLDTGHGAASFLARELFEELGAQVELINAAPDGRNVNAGCGSTHPQALVELVQARGCAMGFSFDGDADRVILADGRGEVRDGDAVLFLWARDLHRQGLLPDPRIVATSMSNLGLEVALGREGIGLWRCGVGDREVVQALRAENLVLGGEQSGHIVHLGLGPSGDGLQTALHIAALCAREQLSLVDLLAGFQRFPQILTGVKVREKIPFESLPRVVAAEKAVVERLGQTGRLVLRYSGTEALARIMIEGPDRAQIEALAAELGQVLAEELSP
jgi:phosphoglucosamine mutase